MAGIINWFEIPATDFDRAVKFYSEVLGREIQKTEMGGALYALFPHDKENIGGAIAKAEGYEPSDKGVTVYFDGGEDLSTFLSKVEPAGGKVLVPKTLITEEVGYFAHFLDTEGNKIGFYSLK